MEKLNQLFNFRYQILINVQKIQTMTDFLNPIAPSEDSFDILMQMQLPVTINEILDTMLEIKRIAHNSSGIRKKIRI